MPTRHTPEPDHRSRFEDEGIPDLQDDEPEQAWAEDPQQEPLPAEEPIAVDDFGTTAEENVRGEPLGDRLGRERPEESEATVVSGAPEEQPGRIVEEDEGAHQDMEKDTVAYESGPHAGGETQEEEALHVTSGLEGEPDWEQRL